MVGSDGNFRLGSWPRAAYLVFLPIREDTKDAGARVPANVAQSVERSHIRAFVLGGVRQRLVFGIVDLAARR